MTTLDPLDETFRGATRFVFLPLDLSAQLRALSRAEGVTLFMLLLAAFQILLSRYTGQELHPRRDPSHHPLFQVMFTMHNAFLQPLELTHVTFHPLVRESSVAKFDLAVLFEETEQGIVGALMYNIDLFDGDTIERMVGHFQTLLAGVVADAACPIAGLPLLTPTEHQQLLYARQTSLHASPWLST